MEKATKKPDVSRVPLTWNRAPFLEICLREMFASFDPDLAREVILMDNCSDDATPNMLAKYAAEADDCVAEQVYRYGEIARRVLVQSDGVCRSHQ